MSCITYTQYLSFKKMGLLHVILYKKNYKSSEQEEGIQVQTTKTINKKNETSLTWILSCMDFLAQ